MPAYDYSTLADLYDDFCVWDDDVEFFRDAAAAARGPVLELMAGTGRVTMPMLGAGADLTCVDSSLSMLDVLSRKLAGRTKRVRLVCGDVCSLPLTTGFELVVLPFRGFSELVGESSQVAALSETARVLRTGGSFICTAHNAAVRGPAADGRWREIGRFQGRHGRTVVLHLKTALSDRPGVVVGEQRVEIHDARGAIVDCRSVELVFSLVSAGELIDMARSVGLVAARMLGDWSGAPYDEASSPTLIAIFEKVG
jgi:SAM-dependent methyltransferase